MNNIDKIYTKDSEKFARSYLQYLTEVLNNIDIRSIGNFIKILLSARERGSTIFFIGNGGSAATASHFANDLSIGTNSYEKPFKALSLTDNLSIITAVGNDFGYEEIFTRQLQVLGQEGDMLIGISASGNSPNLIHAFNFAKSMGIESIAITGFDGGVMKDIADHSIHIATGLKEYGPAEDVHMILDHLITSYLMRFISKH